MLQKYINSLLLKVLLLGAPLVASVAPAVDRVTTVAPVAVPKVESSVAAATVAVPGTSW